MGKSSDFHTPKARNCTWQEEMLAAFDAINLASRTSSLAAQRNVKFLLPTPYLEFTVRTTRKRARVLKKKLTTLWEAEGFLSD
jgi:hypothetical protein